MMFSSVSACAPNSPITVNFYSDKYQTFNIWSNVTVSINGTVTNTRPIKLNITDYVEATVTSPPGYLDYTFYEYQLDFKTHSFAVVNKNSYTPTVKPGDAGKSWYNYVPGKFLITFYGEDKQREFGFNYNQIDMERTHIVLDHINDAVYFYSDKQVLFTRVGLPAGPIEYSKLRVTDPLTGKETVEALILCGNRKMYRIIFNHRYYYSGTYTPTVLPVNSLEALWFDSDTPSGQSYLDARRSYYQSKINPPIKTMSVNSSNTRIWIAGLDTVFVTDNQFNVVGKFSKQFAKFISIACLGADAIGVTKLGEVYHISELGDFTLLMTVEALGIAGNVNNDSLVAIPDPNNQRLILIEAGTLAISYFATPDMAPAYVREFGKNLWVTGHDNNQVYRITSPNNNITAGSTKRIEVLEFNNKVTVISVVNSSYLAVHYLQEFVTLDLTGIRKVIPVQLSSKPGPRTNIGTTPVQIKMLGEENITPVTSRDLTYWVNGLSGTNNVFGLNSNDYFGISFRGYTNGIFRRSVILGDTAFDCDFTVVSSTKSADYFLKNTVAPNRLNQFSTLTNITVASTVNFGTVDTGVVTHLPLGFDWVMYGNIYSDINVSTDGYITFDNFVRANGPVEFGNLNVDCFYIEELTNMYMGTVIDNSDPANIGPLPIGGKDVSMEFNGTAQYLYTQVSAPAPQFTYGNNNFTIEFWVKFNSVSGTQTIVDHRATYPTEVVPTIYITSSRLRYYVNGIDRITGTTILSTGIWYHVAVTKNSNDTNMFLNGDREGSTYTDNNNYVSTRIVIGANVSGSGYLNGYLFNIRIVNGVAVYTANFTPATERLAITQQSNVDGYPSAAIPLVSQTSLLLTNNFVDTSSYRQTIINNGNCVESTQVPFNRTILAPGLYYASGSLNDFNYFRLRWVGIETQPYPAGNLVSLLSSITSSTRLIVSNTSSTNVGDYVSGTGITVSTRVSAYELGILYHVVARKIDAGNNKIILATPDFDITTLQTASTVSNVLATVNHTLTATTSSRYYRTGIPTADRLLYVNPAATTLYVDGAIDNSITADYVIGLPNLPTKTLSGFINKGRTGPTISSSTYSCIPTSFGPFANTGSMLFNGANRFDASLGGTVAAGVFCWTIEFWCYVTNDTTIQCILSVDPGMVTLQKWALFRAPGTGQILIDCPIGVTSQLFTTSIIPINTWVHIAIVGGRNNINDSLTTETSKMYVDGIGTSEFTLINRSTYATQATYTFGLDIVRNALYFNGYISNFRLVNNVKVYTADFTPSTIPLTAVQEPNINGTPSARIIQEGALTGTEMLATTVDNIGIIIDRSDNAAEIINYGGVGLTTAGPIGIIGRYTFNGTNQYLSFPAWIVNNLGTSTESNYTIECWIYRTSDPGAGNSISTAIPIVSAMGPSGNMIWSITSTGYLFSNRSVSTYTFLSATIPNKNNWAHIAFVNVDDTMNVYLDGVNVGSVTLAGTWNNSMTAASIGYNNSAPAKYFQGYISNLRLVAGVAVYTADFAVPTQSFKKAQLSDLNGIPSAAVAATATMLLLSHPATTTDITNVTSINSTTNTITITGVPAETNTVYVSQTDYDKVYENQYVPLYDVYILQKKIVSTDYALVFDTNLTVSVNDQFNTTTTAINFASAITAQYISTNDTVRFSIDELTLNSVANLITGPLNIQQQVVIIDTPQTLSSGTSLLFKTKIPLIERTYEVGFYSGLSYQYAEFFYNNDNHTQSRIIGISSDDSVRASISTHASTQTSVLFTSDIADGKWSLLGAGGFTENSSGYVPYGQLEIFKSTPLFSNESKVELFVAQDFPIGANVLIASSFGQLTVNGADYTGTRYLQKNDVISLTIPYNLSLSVVAPMLSIAELQIVLPMVSDAAINPIFETLFLYDDQDLGIYMSATAIVPIDDLYYIPEYYRKVSNAGNDLQFYLTNLDVFRQRLVPGQYYYFNAGDQIDVDNIITSFAIYDSRDIIITSSSQALRISVRTRKNPVFDYLNFGTLIDPYARQQTYTTVDYAVTVTNEVIVTSQITLAASTTVIGNLYIDTLYANILIDGVDKGSYVTNVTNGNKISISRLIANYSEPPVTIYQVKFDSAISSNVYIPIGIWNMQNKVISAPQSMLPQTNLVNTLLTPEIPELKNINNLSTLMPVVDQDQLLALKKLTTNLIDNNTSIKNIPRMPAISNWTTGFAPKKNIVLSTVNLFGIKLNTKLVLSATSVFKNPLVSNLFSVASLAKSITYTAALLSANHAYLKYKAYKAVLSSNYAYLKSKAYTAAPSVTYAYLKSNSYTAALGSTYAYLKSNSYTAALGSTYAYLKSKAYTAALSATYAYLKSNSYTAALGSNYSLFKSNAYTAVPSANYSLFKSNAYTAALGATYAYLKSNAYTAALGATYAYLKSNAYTAAPGSTYSLLKSIPYASIPYALYSYIESDTYKSALTKNYSYLKSDKYMSILDKNYSYVKPFKFVAAIGMKYSYLKIAPLKNVLNFPYSYASPAAFPVEYTFVTERNIKMFETSITVPMTLNTHQTGDVISESNYTINVSDKIESNPDLHQSESLTQMDIVLIPQITEMFNAPLSTGAATFSELFASSTVEIDVEHLITKALPPVLDIETIIDTLAPNIELEFETVLAGNMPSMNLDNEHLVFQDLPPVLEFEQGVTNRPLAELEIESITTFKSFPLEMEIEHLVLPELPPELDAENLLTINKFPLIVEDEHLVDNTNFQLVVEDEHLVSDQIVPELDAERLINYRVTFELDQEVFWGTDQIDIGGVFNTYISIFANQSQGIGLINSSATLPMMEYTKEYTYIGDKAYLTYEDAMDKASKYYSADAIKIATTDYWNYRIYFNEHHFCVPKKGRIFPVTWYIQGG